MMVEDRPSPQRVTALASELARTLDAEDYDTARRLIADDCVYETGTAAVQGVESIVASYAAAGAWAKRTFEDVRYESQVEPLGDGAAAVQFTDYLMSVGRGWHRYRYQQEFTFDSAGRVTRIVHRELENEREALTVFLKLCGIVG